MPDENFAKNKKSKFFIKWISSKRTRHLLGSIRRVVLKYSIKKSNISGKKLSVKQKCLQELTQLLSEIDMHKILKPMLSLSYKIFICTYTIFKYFFPEINVDRLRDFLCKFFANILKTQKLWLKSNEEILF
jgi:hypothetical protein